MSNRDHHLIARPGVELRGFEYRKVAAIGTEPAGRPGELVTDASTDRNFQWDASSSSWREARTAVTPSAFGAVGDGVTDDTQAFRTIEQQWPQHPLVDLAGRRYVVQSSWVSPTGVILRSDYRDGVIVYGGREIVFDKEEGMRRSALRAALMPPPRSTKELGLYRVDEDNYQVWRPLGGIAWARHDVGRTGPGVPFNWRATFLTSSLGHVTAESPAVTYSASSWLLLGSGSPDLYVGGRARQITWTASPPSPLPQITAQVTAGGDIFVVFAGRTTGPHVAVTLNGTDSHMVLPTNGSGQRYFDSYSPVDLQYKQVVQIASGVPNGTHTVQLTVLAEKNPAAVASPTQFLFNAVAFDNREMGPWSSQAMAPAWQAGQAVLANEERRHSGRSYWAASDGTTGATPPTHLSGVVSDGAVDWTFQPTSTYARLVHRIQAIGSQLEYAYRIMPTGTTAPEDVGGQMHGNEIQDSYRWLASGQTPLELLDRSWMSAESLDIVEDLTVIHSEVDDGTTPVNLTTLRRTFDRGGITVEHNHTTQVEAEYGYFYAAMLPLLHYNSGSGGFKTSVTEWFIPSTGTWRPEDFYFSSADPTYSNSNVSISKDFIAVASGDAYLPNGTVGNLSAGKTGQKFVMWCAVTPESVDHYRHSNRSMCSFLAMNPGNANPIVSPNSSMLTKMYFMRYNSDLLVTLPANTEIRCSARYGLELVPT